MHITITNDSDEIMGVLCVNRETQTCIVLQADVECLEDLVQIGSSLKAPKVHLFVPKDSVSELEPYGWKRDKSLVVLTKERN